MDEKLKKEELFLGKKCKVTYLSNFVLEGTVIGADDEGIIFQTTQETAFINWKAIKHVKPVGE